MDKFIVLQMENCSDGFNVPREHTAKLYIVGKRIITIESYWKVEISYINVDNF
jgi:hypothetical protein